MNIEQERKDFESELLANWGPDYLDFTPFGTRDSYADHSVNALWLIWQARAAKVPANLALTLLGVAKCPTCDGSGAFYNSNGEVEQCQWCYERDAMLSKEG
jgi:hypothetical protein